MLQKQTRILIPVLFALICSNANATNYAERESLTVLLHELETVSLLAEKARHTANPDRRVKFQYSILQKDLARIRMGIQEYLDGPTIEPRQYDPLSGDYRY